MLPEPPYCSWQCKLLWGKTSLFATRNMIASVLYLRGRDDHKQLNQPK